MKHYVARLTGSTKLRFAAVGGVNTVIDFAILNLLAHGIGMSLIPANIISVSVVMSFSFIANRSFIFGAGDGDTRRQVIRFVAVTVIGLYGLQTVAIWALTDAWTEPLRRAYEVFEVFDPDIFITNAAKLLATACTMVWNYTLYKRVVFTHEQA